MRPSLILTALIALSAATPPPEFIWKDVQVPAAPLNIFFCDEDEHCEPLKGDAEPPITIRLPSRADGTAMKLESWDDLVKFAHFALPKSYVTQLLAMHGYAGPETEYDFTVEELRIYDVGKFILSHFGAYDHPVLSKQISCANFEGSEAYLLLEAVAQYELSNSDIEYEHRSDIPENVMVDLWNIHTHRLVYHCGEWAADAVADAD